ncbi:unnamed protein product [Didymodactylos carnosus]|uniref:Uncharacterized protein n=1 Tax=Didymodactylos carnosus TaxID=1234261 RepID=A0A814BFK5_9BILA|nr:unnamed protein product [Didymodactylos carnosus]CAF1541529.1 unnamed protein product [Didymodactylos carnosus]CAF3705358.1 unnamed protein product [Didymodactylos carnosus]CAF4329937.1 unnamed protein product [Didymodactylos carnosus]
MSSGDIDLEAVLNVRRRTLSGVTEPIFIQHRNTDAIYIKRIDDDPNILSIKSRIILFGELNILRTMFERYTSLIRITDEHRRNSSAASGFAATQEVDEEEENEDQSSPNLQPIISTLKETYIRKESLPMYSPSPPTSTGLYERFPSADYVDQLQGKRYGNIELPTMQLMEILEILLKNRFEITYVSSDYYENVLHQNIVFSKSRETFLRGSQWLHRTTSSQS